MEMDFMVNLPWKHDGADTGWPLVSLLMWDELLGFDDEQFHKLMWLRSSHPSDPETFTLKLLAGCCSLHFQVTTVCRLWQLTFTSVGGGTARQRDELKNVMIISDYKIHRWIMDAACIYIRGLWRNITKCDNLLDDAMSHYGAISVSLIVQYMLTPRKDRP